MQKNVLITGAAKRIGASCARLLHAQGYNIFLHYQTSVTQATELRDELNAIRPHSAAIHAADLLQMPELIHLALMYLSIMRRVFIQTTLKKRRKPSGMNFWEAI
jgi:NAD(P)-dependent dehydrogenase (short-subunit alcohol dehydrogenase family)